MIHEFISGTAQSCQAHARMHARLCVSNVHGGLSDIRRQDAVGGEGKEREGERGGMHDASRD